MSKHTPGTWRVQRVISQFPREKFDPSRPYELARREGRYVVRMRDNSGKVCTFATESEALDAAAAKAAGAAQAQTAPE